MSDSGALHETVTLAEAKSLIRCLSHEQSVLLLSPPGVGKSDVVRQAAAEAGLPCKSLLGTQIAPEDVSGVPRIVGERSVFCPPRVLLPEKPEKFCLFLDELPACSPDVQKAFYSLLLERRIGEYPLPEGTWVVAAGNRAEDRALVRTISSALVNRVLILHIRIDVEEWLNWARNNGVRTDVIAFIEQNSSALLRPVPKEAAPFSTPRAWASLSRALDLAEQGGIHSPRISQALSRGRVSAEDAEAFTQFMNRVQRVAPAPELPLEQKLRILIGDLDLSVRATNVLAAEGIDNVGQLLIYRLDEIREFRNIHDRNLVEIIEQLAWLGLSLRPTIESVS